MDAILGMPWHSLALRSAAVCYYLTCGSTVDVVLLAAWALSQTRTPVLRLLAEHVTTRTALAAAAPAVVYILLADCLVQSRARSKQESEGIGSMRPLLFPCTTTHSRMFPAKHSFAYSYLLVGIPVGWEGIAGGMVSAGSSKTWGWYHINAADYLERDNGRSGLRGKLDAFLESQVGCGFHTRPVIPANMIRMSIRSTTPMLIWSLPPSSLATISTRSHSGIFTRLKRA